MGFTLRSGNGPLAFKNMGSSPAKQVNTEESNKQKKIDYESNQYDEAKIKSDQVIKDRADLKKKNEAIAIEKKEKEAYAKTEAGQKEAANKSAADRAAKDKEAKASRGWMEKKKANKVEKKENSKTRKSFKKGNQEEIAELEASGATEEEINAAKKVNKQEQKDLKQSHRDDSKANKKDYKSGDDYKAHKDAEAKKASEIMIGISKNFDPNSQFKSLAEQEAQSSITKRRNQSIEDYELGKNKGMELNTTESAKGGEGVNLEEKPFVASHEKV